MVLWTPPPSLTCVSSYAITLCPREAKCQDPVIQDAEGGSIIHILPLKINSAPQPYFPIKVKPWCSLQEASPPAQTTHSTLCPSLKVSLSSPSLRRQAPTLVTAKKRICWKMMLKMSVLLLLKPQWISSNGTTFRQKEKAPQLRVLYYFSANQLHHYLSYCCLVSLNTFNVQLYRVVYLTGPPLKITSSKKN